MEVNGQHSLDIWPRLWVRLISETECNLYATICILYLILPHDKRLLLHSMANFVENSRPPTTVVFT